MTGRPRVVVCGTKFGRIYLRAFSMPDCEFELAGILAKGSARSRACAEHYDVPLFTEIDDLPADIDIACVVVGSGVNGGPGAQLAQSLMDRGIHVLQEHPLHQDQLADCLRAAHRNGVVYHLNTHYVHVEPVRRFIEACRVLLSKQSALFIDATCAMQTSFTLFDILGTLLGGVRPWAFAEPSCLPRQANGARPVSSPFRSLDGFVAGVPVTLKIQNQMEPSEPDNYVHLFHRITLGCEGGSLTLVNTHGPVIWCPRPHMPAETKGLARMDDAQAAHLGIPSADFIGPSDAPDYRDILATYWPAGVHNALQHLSQAIGQENDSLARGQYYLTLCRLWKEAMSKLGPLELLSPAPPRVLSVRDLTPSSSERRGAACVG